MKFGGFYVLQHPRPWHDEGEHKLLKDALEQVELSDRLGYDYVWATEHHFLEEFAHSSAPEVFLAACSQRTKNVRLGHGIMQMPPCINHPARVAERIATLDLLSDGRCDFGSGSGATETELGGFHVAQDEKKAMWLEALGIAVRMMVEEPFSGFEGRFLQVPQRNVVPKPLQKPHPPLWMACSRRESIIQAARLGMGALTFTFVSPDDARQWVKDYYWTIENAAEPIGHAVNPQFAITCPFLCDRDEKRIEEIGQESYGFFRYGLGHYGSLGPDEPPRTDLWNEYKTKPPALGQPEEPVPDCIGTPEMLRTRLRAYEDAGIDQVICLSQAGKIPHELLCSSVELFSREVLPEFKDRAQSRAGEEARVRERISEKALARKPAPGDSQPQTHHQSPVPVTL